MNMMASNTDKTDLIMERVPGIRDLQQEQAAALAELCKLDLPAVTWLLEDVPNLAGLKGHIHRNSHSRHDAQCVAALQCWAEYFETEIVVMYPNAPAGSRLYWCVRFTFRSVPMVVWCLLEDVAPEVAGGRA